MKKTCRTGRNSHQTATDFNTEAASIQAAIRRDNLMAVWWLFVLEFQFSLGGYRFKLQAVAKRTLSHFLCNFWWLF
jgi:hypothetical protein